MDKCPDCNEYWIDCPCCGHAFCPSCLISEEEAEFKEDEE